MINGNYSNQTQLQHKPRKMLPFLVVDPLEFPLLMIRLSKRPYNSFSNQILEHSYILLQIRTINVFVTMLRVSKIKEGAFCLKNQLLYMICDEYVDVFPSIVNRTNDEYDR